MNKGWETNNICYTTNGNYFLVRSREREEKNIYQPALDARELHSDVKKRSFYKVYARRECTYTDNSAIIRTVSDISRAKSNDHNTTERSIQQKVSREKRQHFFPKWTRNSILR